MKNIILPLLLLLSTLGYGQNLQDALRLSEQDYFSTARTAGVGAAFGAMGADFGSVGYNPASIAAFRSGEFNFSFSGNKTRSEAEMAAENPSIIKSSTNRKLKFDNAGIVIHSKPAGSKWTATNFGFGFSRTANFNQSVSYEGLSKGSFTDRFLERANGRDLDELDDFEGGLAYDVGAIYGPDNQLYYTSDYLSTPNNLLDKNQTIQSRGGIYEMVFAYGANYKERLLFGLSIGVPFINYDEEKYYVEEAVDANSVLKKLEYNEYLSTSGVGINFKAGVVAKLSKIFRLGASVHSPSYYTLQDDYNMEMLYEYNEGNGLQSLQDGSPDGNFKYKFASPWKYTGSFGALLNLGKLKGFIDFDAEYADYSTGEFDLTAYSSASGDQDNEREQNRNIQEQLKPSVTYRVGGEIAYNKLRGRAGYALQESLFANDEFSDSNPTFSLGAGYRGDSYYVDFAWVRKANRYGYTPYELVDFENEQFVSVNKWASKWMFTIGTKF